MSGTGDARRFVPGLRGVVADVEPRREEVARALPGDEVVAEPDVVMDRGFDLAAPIAEVWPWFVQLGKDRGGWYLPRRVERYLPRGGRGLRTLDPALQHLAVGDVIPDWDLRDAHFEVVRLDAPNVLVHRTVRGRMTATWAIVLRDVAAMGGPGSAHGATRVHLRLRLAPVRRKRLATTVGGGFDLATIAGLAAGLRERVER